jgi:hypothetical protein
MSDGPSVVLTERYAKAFDQARLLHAADARKGTTIPYLVHPMTVSAIVLSYGGDEDQAIAALLHDVVEDAGGRDRLRLIRAEFGDEVAAIVEALSDSFEVDPTNKPPWWERKVGYIDRLASGDEPPNAYLVCAADKLANILDTRRERAELGVELWGIFRLGKTDWRKGRSSQLWFYDAIFEALGAHLVDPQGKALMKRLTGELEGMRDDIVADPRENATAANLAAELDEARKQAQAVRR